MSAAAPAAAAAVPADAAAQPVSTASSAHEAPLAQAMAPAEAASAAPRSGAASPLPGAASQAPSQPASAGSTAPQAEASAAAASSPVSSSPAPTSPAAGSSPAILQPSLQQSAQAAPRVPRGAVQRLVSPDVKLQVDTLANGHGDLLRPSASALPLIHIFAHECDCLGCTVVLNESIVPITAHALHAKDCDSMHHPAACTDMRAFAQRLQAMNGGVTAVALQASGDDMQAVCVGQSGALRVVSLSSGAQVCPCALRYAAACADCLGGQSATCRQGVVSACQPIIAAQRACRCLPTTLTPGMHAAAHWQARGAAIDIGGLGHRHTGLSPSSSHRPRWLL